MGIVIVAAVVGLVPSMPLLRWLDRRSQRHWTWEAAECQWALTRQLWDLEKQIREESLSEAEWAWRQQCRTQQAAIRHQARRLDLPLMQ